MNFPWKTITNTVSLVLIAGLSAYCWIILFGDFNILENATATAPQFFQTILGKISLLLFGMITLVCSLALAAIVFDYEPFPTRRMIIENDAGSVGVSLNAIEEFIKRKGKNVTGVRDIQVRASENENGLHLQTKLIVELQKNMPEFIEQFQKKIGYELETTLGIHNIEKVEVLIQKIFPRDASAEVLMMGQSTKLLLKDTKLENESAESKPVRKNDEDMSNEENIHDDNFTVISKARSKKERA